MTLVPSNAELDALALATDARQGEAAMKAVYDFLGRFVAYPSEASRVAHALWIMHTYLMEEWDATPRLAFLSAEPGSGKTRALEITELLVPNPVQAVNVSPAYLFRKVGAEQAPTILFDEIDTVFGPKAKENEEIRGLLNAGHRRGAVAGRCVIRGKAVETEEIAAYCAVALAGLGWLPETLLSRSIIIRMRRRHAGEKVEAYRRRLHAPEGDRVREKIELWARSLSAEDQVAKVAAGDSGSRCRRVGAADRGGRRHRRRLAHARACVGCFTCFAFAGGGREPWRPPARRPADGFRRGAGPAVQAHSGISHTAYRSTVGRPARQAARRAPPRQTAQGIWSEVEDDPCGRDNGPGLQPRRSVGCLGALSPLTRHKRNKRHK